MILGMLVFYLLGVVLTYGRALASFAAIDRQYPAQPPLTRRTDRFVVCVSASSWVGLLAGTILYVFKCYPGEKFLQFSLADIRAAHLADPTAQRWRAMGLIEDISK